MENEIMAVKPSEVAENVQQNQGYGIIERMSRAQKLAAYVATASNIPENYRNKPADCMIAIDMADRMNVSPMFVFQNMYVVKGKPSWSGQACKAVIDNCGKFKNAKHVYFGEEGTDSRGCYITAERIEDGEVVNGVKVTIAMAKGEGWYSKKDKYGNETSKWQTMPELMLAYRAAAFFARVHCPEYLMGLQTSDEIDDISKNEKPVSNLNSVLKGGE